jgi:hypothetical protein
MGLACRWVGKHVEFIRNLVGKRVGKRPLGRSRRGDQHQDTCDRLWGWQVDGTSSGSCSIVGFRIRSVEPWGSTTIVLVTSGSRSSPEETEECPQSGCPTTQPTNVYSVTSYSNFSATSFYAMKHSNWYNTFRLYNLGTNQRKRAVLSEV